MRWISHLRQRCPRLTAPRSWGVMAGEVRDNPPQARYDVLSDGALAGFAQYRLKDTLITISHTEVDPEFEGRGLGSQLAREALPDIRDRGLELVPLCPFSPGTSAAIRTSTSALSPNRCTNESWAVAEPPARHYALQNG